MFFPQGTSVTNLPGSGGAVYAGMSGMEKSIFLHNLVKSSIKVAPFAPESLALFPPEWVAPFSPEYSATVASGLP
ncbi:MAG: hypothetical protein PHD61_03265 [Bacteroidales bacterium]|nr:hypothetical protein [Bacteroidales bacterium]